MKIEPAPGIEARFRVALRRAGRREIGGMLMGEQLAPDHFRIVDFSLDRIAGSNASFRRDAVSHQRTLNEFFERTGRDYERFNYLGEWHSHPSFSVHPSLEDIQTMVDIVEDRGSNITFALLMILRLRLHCWMERAVMLVARGHSPWILEISRSTSWR